MKNTYTLNSDEVNTVCFALAMVKLELSGDAEVLEAVKTLEDVLSSEDNV